jgi:putative addiction module component (TIGR02574 family)
MATLPLSEILKLSVAERIQLAQDIWDSVAADPEALPPSNQQTEELDRRLADLEQNPGAGSAWKDVRGRLLGGK